MGEGGGVTWLYGLMPQTASRPPVIKPHAVCVRGFLPFDLQDLLKKKKRRKKRASCAIYTRNLMLYLLMGAPVIYVRGAAAAAMPRAPARRHHWGPGRSQRHSSA